MDPNKASVSEAEKRVLVEHLRTVAVSGLSGRDMAPIVDATPSRSIFAGVLQAPRVSASGVQLASVDSALGLDFRVVPEPGKHIRLRIIPHWSYYYAVFPSYDQVSEANPAPTSSAAVAAQPQQPNEDENADADEVEEIEDSTPSTSSPGNVVLPRVFRRMDVQPGQISFDLDELDATTNASVGEQSVTAAIDEATQRIVGDTNIWRHLGDPSEGVRILGDRSTLVSESAYASALAAITGPIALPPQWSAALQVSVEPDNVVANAVRIRVSLANESPGQPAGDSGLAETAMFDAGLDVVVESGSIVPFEFLLAPKDYKSNPVMFGKGINCSAVYVPERNCLQTDTLPTYRQPLLRTRDELSVKFAELEGPDAPTLLEKFAVQMDRYLITWDSFLSSDASSSFSAEEISACSADREAFKQEIVGFRLGVECLQRDQRLLRAFQLANRVFSRLAAASGGRVVAWRQFQLGFIVSQLPALLARETSSDSDDDFARRVNRAFDDVGVLWFPTGGGKTEAYLGLLSVTLLFDRLRGKTRGVSAWMRFPLRMLSLQQLERLSKVIAGLNVLRAEEADIKHGDAFAIGYFVGDGVTPNSISEEAMASFSSRADAREKLRVLTKCPFCASRVRIEVDRARWRVLHRCDNDSCFSNTSPSMGAYRGSLPLCITDNEVYRFLPSVLVGTVDKLAIIARSQYFTHIIGGPKQLCEIHGYTSYDSCIERFGAKCQASSKKLKTLPASLDPVPALLIQDELHLLRSELGVFNGHYEGLLKFIGSKTSRAPKVLAATATIEAYDAQAFHLYLSKAKRFPAPSFQNGESFYATSTPLQLRRTFVGILNHTKGIEDAVNRAIGLYWAEIRRLEKEPSRVAEIINRTDLSDEDCRDLLRLYDLSLIYVNRKATGGSVLTRLGRVNAALAREALAPVEGKLLTGDNPVEDVGATLDRIDADRRDTPAPRLNVLIATSLISHGVDLERINSMVMAGMPSRYAEYVQSTSRSARTHPGLVFVCFKGSDAREASQFEFFFPMHEHMDRLIEAVAVNRFASFAPRKTVPGLLAGLLLCDFTPRLYGQGVNKPLDHIPTLQIALGYKPAPKSGTVGGCVDPNVIRESLYRIVGVDEVRPPAVPAEIANTKRVIDEVLDDNLSEIARTLETKLKDALNPILSFRDVDEGIDFGSADSASYVTRLRPR